MKGLEGARVLVTGGRGFIGSHIVSQLVEDGCEVTVYDAGFRDASKDGLHGRVHVVRGNILDGKTLVRVCRDIDVISHQAAYQNISLEATDRVLENNIRGSLSVFDAGCRAGVKKIVYASSETVYGEARFIPEDENHPTDPLHSYGVSKLAVEKFARVYEDHVGIPMVGLRYSNVYGPREWYGRVLTVFLRRVLEGKPPIVLGGHQVRDYVYVTDVVAFHNLVLSRHHATSGIFNVSTGIATSISDLAHLICDLFPVGQPEYLPAAAVPGAMKGPGEMERVECRRMVLDNARARSLGWEPLVPLREGILRQYEWLKENQGAWYSP